MSIMTGQGRRIASDADVALGVEALTRIDPRLIPILDQAGAIPLRHVEAGFAGLAHIIVSQVVSRASANAIWGRMLIDGRPPTAGDYLALPEDTWRRFGLSRAKADTLARIAKAVTDGELDLAGLADLPGNEALSAMTAYKGIGTWTGEVYLMFACGHPDIFPAGDVALQAAVAMAFELDLRPTPKELSGQALLWSHGRSVAARLFWAFYAKRMQRDILPV